MGFLRRGPIHHAGGGHSCPNGPIRHLEFKESVQHPPIRRRCMRLPKREEKHRCWELVRAGASRTEAAVAPGVPSRTAKRWFHQAGGVLTPKGPDTSSARYLSFSEREEIFAGVERGES